MAKDFDYYAVLYVYDEDGSQKVSMPCFNEAEMLSLASKYPKVRVVKDGLPPFWLNVQGKLREEIQKKDIPYSPEHIPLEWLREGATDIYPDMEDEKFSQRPREISDIFYNGRQRKNKISF